jgi:hypothetical protein
MLDKIALMDSAVIKALLAAFFGVLGLVASLFFGVDEAAFGAKAGRLVDGLLLLWTAGTIAYAAYARATKPTPPLTTQAEDATAFKMQAQERDRKSSAAAPPRGFALLSFLQVLFAVVFLAAFLFASGCSGTRAAYSAAQSRPETVLPDTAYVVAEQYRALLKEAADLQDTGRLPVDIVERLRAADLVLKPLVIGDPAANPPTAGLRQLSEAFQAVRTAETEADLQRAVDAAVLALADFLRAVEAARGVQ